MEPTDNIRHYFGVQDDLSAIERYLDYGTRLDVKKGESVITLGDPVCYLYYLKSGEVGRYVVAANGSERIMKIISAKGLLGTVPFFSGSADLPRTNNSEFYARSDCVIYRFTHQCVYDVLLRDETVLHQLIQHFCNRINALNAQLIDTMVRDPAYRICAFLYNFLSNFGTTDEAGRFVYTGKLSHYDIAKYLGLNRVSVTNVLKDLQDRGIIYKDRQKLILLDMAYFHRL